MDSSLSPPPPTKSRPHFALLGVIALAAAGYGWFIYQHCSPYAGGSDSAGYLNSARLLVSGHVAEPVRTVPGLAPPEWSYYFHQSLGCIVNPQTGRWVPSYPIGLPMHYALASLLAGFEKAARLVNVFNALAAGVLLYALGRQLGLARGWALAGTALLWACPVWIYQSLQPMSDSIATTWGLAAILCAWRGRERPAWEPAAGAVFAMAVLVRPTSLLLLLPLAVILGLRWRSWLGFALGGLPFALGLGYYNFSAYGGILASGYNQGDQHILDAFGREFFSGNLRHFAAWIPRLLSLPLVAAAVLGLPWLVRRTPRQGLMLAAWFAAFVGFYSCYFCAGEAWWYLRFLLPAFPAVILAGLLALQFSSTRLLGPTAWLAPTAVLGLCLVLQSNLAKELRVTGVRGSEHHYWLAGNYVREQVPADAILLTWQLSGSSLFYNTQPIVRWDLTEPVDFARLCRAAAALHRPIYAPLFAFEKAALQKKLGGAWVAVGHPGIVTVWRLAAPSAPEVAR